MPKTGEPTEDSHFPTISFHPLPPGFHSQPVSPFSLLGRHVFKLCRETEGAISLSVASIDFFQDAEDLLPLIPAPSQLTNSPHLPPSHLSALGWGQGTPLAHIHFFKTYCLPYCVQGTRRGQSPWQTQLLLDWHSQHQREIHVNGRH